MATTTPLQDLRQQIRLLYDNGLKEQALKLEENFRSQGHLEVGSVQTDIELEKFKCEQDPQGIPVNPQIRELKYKVGRLANIQEPVLILGESGTGKSIIAKALHGSRNGKFVQVNCTALTDELIASELFGHVKGSFTGAVIDKVGKLQEAAGGTVFLDEIGDMPLSMQTKLLKAVEEKWICRVGANEEIKINCRIIGATNKVDIRKFIRDDLYWRLSVFELHIPPLRVRRGDIKYIAEEINPSFNVEYWLASKPKDYAFHGNVRELRRDIMRSKYLG